MLTLLPDKGQTPREHIHKIRKPIWVRCTVELSDIHHITFVFEHCGLVVVYIEIIGRREDRHDRREASGFGFAVHTIASVLGFVGADDREEVVAF